MSSIDNLIYIGLTINALAAIGYTGAALFHQSHGKRVLAFWNILPCIAMCFVQGYRLRDGGNLPRAGEDFNVALFSVFAVWSLLVGGVQTTAYLWHSLVAGASTTAFAVFTSLLLIFAGIFDENSKGLYAIIFAGLSLIPLVFKIINGARIFSGKAVNRQDQLVDGVKVSRGAKAWAAVHIALVAITFFLALLAVSLGPERFKHISHSHREILYFFSPVLLPAIIPAIPVMTYTEGPEKLQ